MFTPNFIHMQTRDAQNYFHIILFDSKALRCDDYNNPLKPYSHSHTFYCIWLIYKTFHFVCFVLFALKGNRISSVQNHLPPTIHKSKSNLVHLQEQAPNCPSLKPQSAFQLFMSGIHPGFLKKTLFISSNWNKPCHYEIPLNAVAPPWVYFQSRGAEEWRNVPCPADCGVLLPVNERL